MGAARKQQEGPESLPPDGGVDAGLLLLEAATPAGVELSQGEIAYVCGCSRAYIYWLEKSAIRFNSSAARAVEGKDQD